MPDRWSKRRASPGSSGRPPTPPRAASWRRCPGWARARRAGGCRASPAGVDWEVGRGECLAVVGESGSGKTTLALCLLRLLEPTAGKVTFAGEDLLALRPEALRRRRRRFQMVYQDPFDALDPRQRIGAALAEPLLVHGLVAACSTAAPARRRR